MFKVDIRVLMPQRRRARSLILLLILLCATLAPRPGWAADQDATLLPFFIGVRVTTETGRFYRRLIDEFEEQHPDIIISLHPCTSYNQVLFDVLHRAKEGQPAGVAVVEISELLTLQDGGAIIPLRPLITRGRGSEKQFLGRFVPGFLANSYGDGGEIYGLPFNRSTPIIYYNLDLLKKAGIPMGKLPTSWDELAALLQFYRNRTGQPPLGLAGTWFEWIFESFVYQNGGSLANEDNTRVNFNSPPVVQTLEFWQQLRQKGLMARVRDWRATMNSFVQLQRYPVIYYSSAGLPTVQRQARFNWTATVMPKNTAFGAGVGATNIFLSSHLSPRQQEAGWKFINFLLSDDIQARIALNSGYFPVVNSAFSDPRVKGLYDSHPAYKNGQRQLGFARAKIMTRNFKEVRKILQNAINETLDHDVPAKVSLARAQRQAEQLLQGGTRPGRGQ